MPGLVHPMPVDPEVAEFLAKAAASGAKPRSAMTIAETREFAEKGNAFSGPTVELAHVYDSSVASVPVRFYEPVAWATAATILYLHGGRFISGNLYSHDALCRTLAANSGCTVVAVDYRLAPEHRFPSALDDSAAVANGLTGPLVIGGDSAGGNLAAAVALAARDRFLAQVLVYPMLDASCSLESHVTFASGYGPGSEDMMRGWREYGFDAATRDPRLSPLWAENVEGLPPTLIISAEYDSLRDEAERYARRLTAAGVDVTLRRFDGAIHGFFQMAGVLSIGRAAVRLAALYIRLRVEASQAQV